MGDVGMGGLLITVTQSHRSQLPKGGCGPGRLLERSQIKVTPAMGTGSPRGQRERQAVLTRRRRPEAPCRILQTCLPHPHPPPPL